jgi:hypothetical protein
VDNGTWMTKKMANASAQLQRGPHSPPKSESPAVKQRRGNQRLQQVIGQRHPSRHRDRLEAPLPCPKLREPHDRQHVETHHAKAREDIGHRHQDLQRRRPWRAGVLTDDAEGQGTDHA